MPLKGFGTVIQRESAFSVASSGNGAEVSALGRGGTESVGCIEIFFLCPQEPRATDYA